MRRIVMVSLAAALACSSAALAHHGWGGYDAKNPVTASGPILTVNYGPHSSLTVKSADKVWTVILAPASRMTARGADTSVVAVGKAVSAYGYPSLAEKDEMRAERITVDGKTYELR